MIICRLDVTMLCVAVLLSACSSGHVGADSSAARLLTLESRLADLKASWIQADVTLLSTTCSRLVARIRTRIAQQGNTVGLSEYDERKQVCNSLVQTRASLSRAERQALDAKTGDAYEDVQRGLEELRTTTDAAIQSFPTASFRESNYPPAAASAYRAAHETDATEAGRLATDAVSAARDASGAAMQQAQSTNHELDRTRARLADEGYTLASAQLQQLAQVTSAPEILAKVNSVFSQVDGAIGTAQGAGRVGGNPVGVAHEAVPSVEPTAFVTASPSSVPSVDTNSVVASSPSLSTAGALLYQTKEMQILGSSGCQGSDATMIRFKDDGTSGCAQYKNAIRGQLAAGPNVVLIPVTAAGRGTIFALLYADEGAHISFIGILPGDGTGDLSVTLEDGVIVERNGSRMKRSTLRGHRVILL